MIVTLLGITILVSPEQLANAAYFRVANIVFFTTNAQKGIYFCIYNAIYDAALRIFLVSSRNICTQKTHYIWQKKMWLQRQ